MSARTILAVPGLSRTTPEFRASLWEMAERNGWPVDALATIMSIESGFQAHAKNPLATASGLIQFIDSTARSLGVAGGAAEVRTMSAVEQLPLVERYYQRAGLGAGARPVDFYLAGWGSGVGKPFSHVLARASDPLTFGGKHNLYTLNRGLDADGDGVIRVGDIAAKMDRQAARAGGKRLDAEPPTPGTTADGGGGVGGAIALGLFGFGVAYSVWRGLGRG